jgi:hypothetical protein
MGRRSGLPSCDERERDGKHQRDTEKDRGPHRVTAADVDLFWCAAGDTHRAGGA